MYCRPSAAGETGQHQPRGEHQLQYCQQIFPLHTFHPLAQRGLAPPGGGRAGKYFISKSKVWPGGPTDDDGGSQPGNAQQQDSRTEKTVSQVNQHPTNQRLPVNLHSVLEINQEDQWGVCYTMVYYSSIYNLNKLDWKFISSKKIKSKQVSENITLLLCFLF